MTATPAPSAAFLRLMRSRWSFAAYVRRYVPMAAFARIRIESIDADRCRVSVPYSRRTTNPFRSTYFGALTAAAELSTGILAMAHLYDHRDQVAMLMVNCRADFDKKATDVTVFECDQGAQVAAVIAEAIAQPEPRTLTMQTVGKNQAGNIVARMEFTWSFKARSRAA